MKSSNQFNKTPIALLVASTLSVPVLATEESASYDEQMVVTATQTETTLKSAPASISVITADEILTELDWL